MTITLPDDVREQAERQAKAAGFADVGDYLADLVREDAEAGPPPDQYAGRTREEFERLINETVGCEWKTMDEAFWERLDQRIRAKAAARGETA
jgi:hypothetical protein